MSHTGTPKPKKPATAESNAAQPKPAEERRMPKPESSSEYEGAPSRKPTGNPPLEVKTETSSSSGE
ncbi:hypothetical protein SE17_09990 [Kouleothrix aurantiaca]|uniref:Uncharacterized protein n=1 Tax=Kouleothrix aurantiaca TaxID=186479 RepID=A0A0P9DC68_9CHLR|nr:hypothetical protein SE17_09990 [Kouleothrix aurantiaca]